MASPKITKIEQVVFEYTIQNMGTDYNGFNGVYEKGMTRIMHHRRISWWRRAAASCDSVYSG